jgi:hypothetical protein
VWQARNIDPHARGHDLAAMIVSLSFARPLR